MCLPRPPHIGVPLLARGKVYCKMFLSKLDSTTPVTCVVGGWRGAGSDRQVPDWCVVGEYHSLTQFSVWAYLDSRRARRALWLTIVLLNRSVWALLSFHSGGGGDPNAMEIWS